MEVIDKILLYRSFFTYDQAGEIVNLSLSRLRTLIQKSKKIIPRAIIHQTGKNGRPVRLFGRPNTPFWIYKCPICNRDVFLQNTVYRCKHCAIRISELK